MDQQPRTPRDQMIQPLRTHPRRIRNSGDISRRNSENPTRLYPRFIDGDDFNNNLVLNRINDSINSLSTPSREALIGVNITMTYDGHMNFNVGATNGFLERNKRF